VSTPLGTVNVMTDLYPGIGSDSGFDKAAENAKFKGVSEQLENLKIAGIYLCVVL